MSRKIITAILLALILVSAAFVTLKINDKPKWNPYLWEYLQRDENYEANEDLKPYGIFSHRHNSEIDFILSLAQKNTHVIFTPHLLPVNRGILSTIYFKTKAGKEELENTIREKYKGRYFVRVKNTIPAIRYVANTNFIDIAVYKKDDTAIIVSAIDNLLKGASGQAVQCFNIMQNIDETTGLI